MQMAGVSAQELADRCNIANVQTVYNMMSGNTTRIAPEMVACLCRVLHTDANFLYDIKYEKSNETIKVEWVDITQDGNVIARNQRVFYADEKYWRMIGESNSQFEKRVIDEIKRKYKKIVNLKII